MRDILGSDKTIILPEITWMPRKMLIATLLAMTFNPAQAQDAMTTEKAASEWQACAAIGLDPVSIEESLEAFDVVYGKPAIDWTDDDYNQLMELAIACDGISVDGHVIDSEEWYAAIEGAKEAIFEISGVHQIIMDDADSELDDKVPYCTELMTYKSDDWAMQDNSAELFGEPFLTMSASKLKAAVEHMNACLAFLPEYGKITSNSNLKETTDFIYAIIDKALLIQQHRDEWRRWVGKRQTDVLVTENGQTVPPTFTSPETQKLIIRFNKAASFNGGFSLEAISALLELSDDVVEANVSRIDVAYANEIRRLVQQDIFNRTEHKLE